MTEGAEIPFPLRVEHFEHEPAHSLLLRTAARNGTSLFSLVYKRLGVDHGRSVHAIDPTVIAAKCSADASAVTYSTAKMDDSEFTLLGQTFSRDHWGGHYRKWCPLCLKQAPYHRAWWDLSIITACGEHGLELVSLCPCDRKLQQGHQSILRCRNNHDLTDVPTVRVDDAELTAERYIISCLTSQEMPKIDVLQGVSLGEAINVMEWLGKFRFDKTGNLFELRRELGQRRLMNTGFSILRDFPRAYDELLDDMVAGRTGKPRKRNWGVEHAYGDLNPWLVARLRENPDDSLARRLKDRLDEHSKVNIVLKGGYVASGEVVVGTSLLNVAKRCGMSFEVFVRIAGKLDLISSDRKSGRPERVTKERADAIVERINSFTTMERATELLGVASERVIELVDDGMIAYVDRPYDRSSPSGRRGDPATLKLRDRPSNKWLFEPDVMPAFLARLEGMSTPHNQDGYSDLMPVSAVGILYTSVLRAVQLVLAGKLFIRGFDDSAKGLARLLVSRSEAAEAFKLDRRGGNLALRDAAPLMGMNYNQLRGCVKAGLVVPLGTGKATYLTDELVEEFSRTYIRASEIAEVFGSGGSRVVIRYLREAGMEPVGTKDSLGVTLYRRDEAVPLIRQLPPPIVFTSTRERASYQKAKGLELRATRRSSRSATDA